MSSQDISSEEESEEKTEHHKIPSVVEVCRDFKFIIGPAKIVHVAPSD